MVVSAAPGVCRVGLGACGSTPGHSVRSPSPLFRPLPRPSPNPLPLPSSHPGLPSVPLVGMPGLPPSPRRDAESRRLLAGMPPRAGPLARLLASSPAPSRLASSPSLAASSLASSPWGRIGLALRPRSWESGGGSGTVAAQGRRRRGRSSSPCSAPWLPCPPPRGLPRSSGGGPRLGGRGGRSRPGPT